MNLVIRLAGAALVVAVAACGEGGNGSPAEPRSGGLVMSLRHTEPLRAGAPVTWTLLVHNDGNAPLTLDFPTGQEGEVVLRQDGQERYRWGRDRFFTQVIRAVRLEPGQDKPVTLQGTLEVPPGRYELVAFLTSRPAPPEVRHSVTVER